ncbi:tRNA(Ile)-lysidine synthetase [Exophiala mesophila]|uniref:tRNA(Ile)-lysidine synthetase n=1 Tax=Exophiala mesophila TaxID=212818 RepID=A0A0D1XZQ0_EXOME|nr:tRNA(Ile)-lysidine synthetase [Exophiala mesophila]KIV93746.1 tRNA(Ile)-lysidine synthetase [Exophiala mesophila]
MVTAEVLARSNLASHVVRAVRQLWYNGLEKHTVNGVAKLGVCVSGGPDSMALAALLKRVPELDHELKIEPVAFIINHNARPESGAEAASVNRNLLDYGIKSQTLHMQWPDVAEPLALPNFEAVARYKRYRMFARAALDANIRHLFLGHHQDDQVETIMMRLLKTQTRSFLSLQGIYAQGAIPCCEDIPGVTGLHPDAYWPEPSPTSPSQDGAKEAGYGDEPRSPGIQIHRPLLDYPKSELIDTCTTLGIRYVTDPSNFDPKITMRNAIRHLRSKYRLPRALQAPSILQLLKSSRESMADLNRRGGKCLQKARVVHFDPRVGFMQVYFEPAFRKTCRKDPEAAAYALAKLTAVVSPQSRDVVPTVVPEDRLKEFQAILISPNNHGSVTMQQVWLEKLAISPYENQTGSLWQLSRPPLRKPEIVATTASFQPLSKIQNGNYISHWLLWDRRFWIRVKAKTSHDIEKTTVETFGPSRLADIKRLVSKARSLELSETLSNSAPDKLRYTIPVLLYDGQLLSLPTLDFAIRRSAERSPIVGWESYFKEIPQALL